MDYLPPIQQTCPVEIAVSVKSLDLTDGKTGDFLIDMVRAPQGTHACMSLLVGYIAEKVGPSTHPFHLQTFFHYAAYLHESNSKEVVSSIRKAALRVSPEKMHPLYYFSALWNNKIDIRKEFEGKIAEDWGFDPRRYGESITWYYSLYLGSFGDEEVWKKIQRKIKSVKSGNDAYNLIRSLENLDHPRAKEIISSYLDDPRLTDAPDGPGMSVGELLRAYNPDLVKD